MALSKADLLKRASRTYLVVEDVRIQSLTELERTALEGLFAKRLQELREADVEAQLKAIHRNHCELLIWTLVDDDNVRMFEMGEESVAQVGSMSPDLFGKLYTAARKHVGFGNDDKEVDDNLKKSSETQDSN